jgi:hypothetical protein
VAAQVVLGIVVTVRAPYAGELLLYGVLHQLGGVLLLAALVVALVRVKGAVVR